MFIIQGEHYMIPSPMDNDPLDMGDKSMDVQASKALHLGLKFNHEYDFGTSTYLTLNVISERTGRFNSPIRLLSAITHMIGTVANVIMQLLGLILKTSMILTILFTAIRI